MGDSDPLGFTPGILCDQALNAPAVAQGPMDTTRAPVRLAEILGESSSGYLCFIPVHDSVEDGVSAHGHDRELAEGAELGLAGEAHRDERAGI